MDVEDLEQNYQIFVTKSCLRQGEKLPITRKEKLSIIKVIKNLKFWPGNKREFEYETAYGATEFKFNGEAKDHWVRAFVYFDDDRKIAWVFRVVVKKENDLKAHRIAIETAVSSIEADIELWKKEQKKNEKQKQLLLMKGGQSE